LAKVVLMIYAGGEFSINKLYSLVAPPHQAAYGVLVKVILMIYSASQNMIYAGGEFSFDKISRFCYPASSSRLRALTKVILM